MFQNNSIINFLILISRKIVAFYHDIADIIAIFK